jgi:hypothetical protein
MTFHVFLIWPAILLNSVDAKNTEPLAFSAYGFEHCIFNLIYYDMSGTVTSSTLTVLDRILNSSQATQLWTISIADRWLLARPLYLKEKCSINIFVASGDCAVYPLLDIFKSRIFSADNTIVFVYVNKPANCSTKSTRSVSSHYDWPHSIMH